MDYDKVLDEKFKDLIINLVRHDDSPTGLPAYIEVHLGRKPSKKEMGAIVLDLGNYIYRRFGLSYQMCPEYRGRGRATTLRWFMSWKDIQSILPNIRKATDCKIERSDYLPYEFRSLIIQNTNRGVYPQRRSA